MQPVVRTKDIGGIEIQYLHYPGDGPTVIFLHATGFLPWLWHPIARSLCDGYNVIAPYFCDHRTAEPEQGGVSWLLLAEDVSRLAETLRIDSPFIVGHSMGATVSALAIARFGLNARGGVLIEPIFLPEQIYGAIRTVDQHPLASRSIRRRSEWKSVDEAEAYLMSKPLFSRWDPEMIRLYLRYGMSSLDGGGLALACSPRREASLFMGSSAENPWPLLPGIRCPSLILEGELSENRNFIDLPKAASLMPAATYRLVIGAGHLIPMEMPAETARIIQDFFGPCA